MALIVAGLVALGTMAYVVLIIGADMISDAPSQEGINSWPPLIIGLSVAGLIAASHWYHLSW
jgi:hypothetical protein